MRPVHCGHGRREDWNALVSAEPRFSLHQSWEWGEFKRSLGWEPHRIAIEREGKLVAGAQLLIKKVPAAAASVGYVARGPVGDWEDEEITAVLLKETERVARDSRAVFLRLEPGRPWRPGPVLPLARHGFRPVAGTIQPEATIVLDLRRDLEFISGDFRGKTRQYIQHAKSRGITVRAGEAPDLPAVRELFIATARRAGFPARLPAYYEREWRCLAATDNIVMLLAFHDRRLVASRTVTRFGRHAAEFHAGSLSPLPGLHPNHLLVWEALRWAKDRGCLTYDMWGVPDEAGRTLDGKAPDASRTDGMWGVYRFKRGFGRSVVRYAGAFDLVLRPGVYALMGAAIRHAWTFERMRATLDRLRRAGRKRPELP